MTDRIQGFIVTLDKDIREDDVQPILDAIKQIRCVADVSPMVTDPTDHMARVRVKIELGDKLLEFWKENLSFNKK